MSERKGVLRNRGATNISIELRSLVPRAAAKLRRASPYATVPVTLTRDSTIDVAKVLNCSREEALRVIDATPFIKAMQRRGVLEVL